MIDELIASISSGAMRERTPMSDEALLGIIHNNLQQSSSYYGSDLASSSRVDAERYYKGEKRGDEQLGRSSVVSRDLQEIVDSMMPSLLRIFMGGEDVVLFEPFGAEDEEAAQQATDYINWIFNQKNDGLLIFYTWFMDALLKRNGIVKTWYEKRLKREKQRYEGLTEYGLQTLMQANPNVEFASIETYPDPTPMPPAIDPMTGMAIPQPPAILINCEIVCLKEEDKICVANVPPEEFVILGSAASLEDTTFVAQRGVRTIGDMVSLGYDIEVLKKAPMYSESNSNTEKTERLRPNRAGILFTEDDGGNIMARRIQVTEAFLKVDFDGDGLPEWRKITLLGGEGAGATEILENVEVDDHHFASITPYIVPHSFFGRSIYDQTKDIQDIKTSLMRGCLDAIYLANQPALQVQVNGIVSMDDVLDSRIGKIVRTTVPGAVMPIPTVNAAPQAFTMLEYLDLIREQRTGITRYNQGMNADSLNKTARGIELISSAGQQRPELIARVFAETGVKRLFRLLFKLTCQHMNKPQVVKLRNKWIEVNPADWKDRMDVTVSVGIGMGNKEQQLSTAMTLLQLDQQIVALQGGVKGPLLNAKNIYNKLKKVVEAAGWKSVDPFYVDPDIPMPPEEPPPPPPEAIKAQFDVEKAKAEAEMKQTDVLLKRLEYATKLLENQVAATIAQQPIVGGDGYA